LQKSEKVQRWGSAKVLPIGPRSC